MLNQSLLLHLIFQSLCTWNIEMSFFLHSMSCMSLFYRLLPFLIFVSHSTSPFEDSGCCSMPERPNKVTRKCSSLNQCLAPGIWEMECGRLKSLNKLNSSLGMACVHIGQSYKLRGIVHVYRTLKNLKAFGYILIILFSPS